MKLKQLSVLIIMMMSASIANAQNNPQLDWAFATFDETLPFGEVVDSNTASYTYLLNGDSVYLDHYNFGRKLAIDKWNNNIFAANIAARYFDLTTWIWYDHSSNASADLYLRKSDTYGDELWTKHIGGIGHDRAWGIDTDTSGNIVFCGEFTNTVDFNPGATPAILNSGAATQIANGFILKLDPNGQFIFAKQIECGNQLVCESVEIDHQGNYIVSGIYTGTADFDPGVGVVNESSSGGDNPFVLKLDSNGNYIWHYVVQSTFGGTLVEESTVDSLGNVYVVGSFVNTLEFDALNIITSSGWSDGFMFKLDSNGIFQWDRHFVDNGDWGLKSVHYDGNDLIITGVFEGFANVNLNGSGGNLISMGVENSFIQKITTDGLHIWTQELGTEGLDIYAASVNSDKETVVSGTLWNTSIFSTSLGSDTLSPGILTAVIDSTGTIQWAESRTDEGEATDVIYDHGNNILVCGIIDNTFDFDTNDSTAYILEAEGGGHDSFLFQLDGVCQEFIPITANSCGSYTSPSGNYVWSSTGIYSDTINSSMGCDSIFTVDLTINTPTVAVDVVTACESYTWIDNVTYTSNNSTATFTLLNSIGCDSIVTLNLTITSPSVSVDVVAACESYTWIDNVTYTSDNSTATFILANSNGCDSVVTLNLSISTLDISVTALGSLLTSNDLTSSYQWLNCDSSYALVVGATNQTFTPSVTGNYAVQVTNSGCIDTSACVNVDFTSIDDLSASLANVYPNPTTENVSIDFVELGKYTITIYNTLSQEISHEVYFNDGNSYHLSIPETKGMYWIKLEDGKTSSLHQIIKL